jgi:hypothetical protein
MKPLKSFSVVMALVMGCAATRPATLSATSTPVLESPEYALVIDRDVYTLPEAMPVSVFYDSNTPIMRGPFVNGEAVSPIRRTQPAPFDGVVFNPAAVARVEVEFRGQQALCYVDSRRDQQAIAARANADLDRLIVSFRTHDSLARSIIEQQQRDYSTLVRATQQASSSNVWRSVGWTTVGVLSGLVVGGVVGYTISAVRSAAP